MVKCRSFAAAAVGALFLFPGVSVAQGFEPAFAAAVAEAGFEMPEIPDFSSALADAGFGELEGQPNARLQAFEDERDALLEAFEEERGGLIAFFEGLLAALTAERDELAATEPGPDDFVLENKPGGVIDCTNGVCVTPPD